MTGSRRHPSIRRPPAYQQGAEITGFMIMLPVNLIVGGPPGLILSAIAPLPENVPEVVLASLIAGGKIRQCIGPDGRHLMADAELADCHAACIAAHRAMIDRLRGAPGYAERLDWILSLKTETGPG